MTKARVGALRSRLFSGSKSKPTQDDVFDVLSPYFDDQEDLKYSIPGKGGLVHEDDGETEEFSPGREGDSLIVVTDHRILITVVSPETEEIVDIPYDDVRKLDVDDGLLRSTLTVAVWHDGTYRLKTKDSGQLGSAMAYMTEAVECWQFARSMIERAEEQIPKVGEHIEAGRLGEARFAREEARDQYRKAKNVMANAEIESIPGLETRIESEARELARTEIHARLARAKTLVAEAKHQTDSRAYTGAYERYWTARDQLENAIMLARQADIEEPAVIEAGLDSLDARIENLRVQPLALAKQARERAETTEKIEVEANALAEAYEHYRDALEAGWGTNYDFAGDTQHIRFQIELVVGELVPLQCELAETHLENGNEYWRNEDPRSAKRQWEKADEQLDTAEKLARQYQSGSLEEIAEVREKINRRLP